MLLKSRDCLGASALNALFISSSDTCISEHLKVGGEGRGDCKGGSGGAGEIWSTISCGVQEKKLFKLFAILSESVIKLLLTSSPGITFSGFFCLRLRAQRTNCHVFFILD